jgi:hypothetical protein
MSEIGSQAERFLVAGDRLVHVLAAGQGDPQVVVGIGIGGPQLQSGAVGLDRLGEPPAVAENVAQIV